MDAQATGGAVVSPSGGFLRFFQQLPDPRAANSIHKLSDILTIAFCAVVCGADSWVDVEMFGNSKLPWLRSFLELPGGIPSHDTFGRVFAMLSPEAFEESFQKWMSWARASGKGLIAIDGKSIRRSFEHAWDKSGMAHLLSAYAAANGVLGQIAIGGKENEITAIPKLLAMLDLERATVTIDAIGCQREIAEQITQSGGDYILALKQNQPTLYAKVKALLDEAILEDFAGLPHARTQETEGEHGRIEVRRAWVTGEVQHLRLPEPWPGLRSIAVVESRREVNGACSVERRYFVSSHTAEDAAFMAGAIRGHWQIENALHWQLDVSFREDECRVRTGHAAENLSRLRRMALNRLKSDRTLKVGVAAKRKRAGWDEPYLLKLLTS